MNQPITNRENINDYIAEGNKLAIRTKDNAIYFFNEHTYKVADDTLYGKGQWIIQNLKQDPEQIKIAVNNISQIRVTEYQAAGSIDTLIMVVVAIALSVGAILLIHSGLEDAFKDMK